MLTKAIHFTKQTKNDYLLSLASLFGVSSSDEAIRNAVSVYGYDARRLTQGNDLYRDLNALENEHIQVGGEKTLLVSRKQLMQKAVSKEYMKFLKIARIAFAENEYATDLLMLEGIRERIFNKWFSQVMVFVNNLLNHPELMSAMGEYGVKNIHIEKLKAEVENLSDLIQQCNKIANKHKQLTQKKQKQTIKVQAWVSDYIKIARIALEDQPQHLEKMGIKSPGVGRPRGRKRKSDMSPANPAS